MRFVLFLALLVAPTLALAAKHCEYRLPQDADIPLVDAHHVVFDMGRHSLTLTSGAAAGQIEMRGDACASSLEYLRLLQVAHKRDGDRLIVTASGGDNVSSGWMGRRYAAIDLTVKVPAGVSVEVRSGSGAVTATDVAQLSIDAASSIIKVQGGNGDLRLSLGTGEADVAGIGQLTVGSLGDGKIRVRRVGGNVQVGSVGAGKLDLRDITGNIVVDSVGSGTVNVDTVGGSLTVHALDKDGDVEVDDVDGTVSLPDKTKASDVE